MSLWREIAISAHSLRNKEKEDLCNGEDHDNQRQSSSTAFSSHKVSTAALHSSFTMTASSYTVVAAVACLSVGGAMTSTQAFSPPQTQTTTIANCRLPRVRHGVVPTSSSRTRQQSCQILHNIQQKSTSLKSAVEETIETTPEAFNSKNDSLHNDQVDTTPELLTSLDTTPSSDAPQELQNVLSSPELLDPVSILNATLPSLSETDEEEELDISTTSSGAKTLHSTTLDDDNVEYTNAEHNAKKKKVSKEEDLELTVLAILRHIGDISSADTVLDDEDDEEEGEHFFAFLLLLLSCMNPYTGRRL